MQQPHATTRLTGPILDQAALVGVLLRTLNLGLILFSVERFCGVKEEFYLGFCQR
jgi:hypothetical protein